LKSKYAQEKDSRIGYRCLSGGKSGYPGVGLKANGRKKHKIKALCVELQVSRKEKPHSLALLRGFFSCLPSETVVKSPHCVAYLQRNRVESQWYGSINGE